VASYASFAIHIGELSLFREKCGNAREIKLRMVAALRYESCQ
jgi:hypothetical protein